MCCRLQPRVSARAMADTSVADTASKSIKDNNGIQGSHDVYFNLPTSTLAAECKAEGPQPAASLLQPPLRAVPACLQRRRARRPPSATRNWSRSAAGCSRCLSTVVPCLLAPRVRVSPVLSLPCSHPSPRAPVVSRGPHPRLPPQGPAASARAVQKYVPLLAARSNAASALRLVFARLLS